MGDTIRTNRIRVAASHLELSTIPDEIGGGSLSVSMTFFTSN